MFAPKDEPPVLDSAGLAAAVAAGIIAPAQADQLRAFAGARADRPQADDEQFRLVTSFNDIFVTLAILLFVGALAFLVQGFAGFILVAAGWSLSELFVRRRRMALPGIVLALMNIAGAIIVALMLAGMGSSPGRSAFTVAGVAAALAALAHFWRYRVPIDIMLAYAALAWIIGGLLSGFSPQPPSLVILAIGLLGLALAVAFDMRDPMRRTINADIAFWLHLASAPAIVHGLRTFLTVLAGGSGSFAVGGNPVMWAAIAALCVFALVIDRRALIVSSLLYIVAGLIYVFSQIPGLKNSAALAVLVVGALLISLSVGWPVLRRMVVSTLPLGALRDKLPPVR